MSISERKERERKELRMKIINAAAEIIAGQGEEALTIRKVAKKVEYSPRTIYLYFQDKDDLIFQVVETAFQMTLDARSLAPPVEGLSPKELFYQRIHTHIRNGIENPHFYRAVITLIFQKAMKPGKAQQQIINQTKKDLHKLTGDGVSEQEVEILSEILFASLRGFTISLVNKMDTLSEKEIQKRADQFISFFFHGMKHKRK
ncbi:MAG: TetR/AcrR family transcriptional regulator [Spirochaetia bacterium]